MMNKIQQGNVLKYANNGTSEVLSGQLLKIGELFGVASVDIPVGGSGAVVLAGVYEIPCTLTADVAQGAKLYFKESDGTVTDTAEGNAFCGICFEKAQKASTAVALKIGWLTEAAAAAASVSGDSE